MRDYDKTPSPERAERSSGRERSPWTAQRVRKKGRSSPDVIVHLPELPELGPETEFRGLRSQATVPMDSLGHSGNPFLHQLSMSDMQDNLTARASFDIDVNQAGPPNFSRCFDMDSTTPNLDPSDTHFTFAPGPSQSGAGDSSALADTSDDEAAVTPARAGSVQQPEGKFLADVEHGILLLQRTPLREITANEENIADTPSPGVPAPGIRETARGKAPPRVPSSCRTIRRVLVDSPPTNASSRRSSWRGEGTRESSPFRPIDGTLGKGPQREHTPLATAGRRRPLTACLEDASRPSKTATQFTEGQESDAFTDTSPDFVISRGRVTPNNLIPSWDEDYRGNQRSRARHTPMQETVRGLDLKAVGEGSEVDGQQAWQDVRSGSVKPDDIDTLNALLKAYCRVDGDPKEAEQVIKDACLGGRITPNASTYHHMATLWTQHEQIHNFQ